MQSGTGKYPGLSEEHSTAAAEMGWLVGVGRTQPCWGHEGGDGGGWAPRLVLRQWRVGGSLPETTITGHLYPIADQQAQRHPGLIGNADSQALPGPPESEMLGRGPDICVLTSPRGFCGTQVAEPLSYCVFLPPSHPLPSPELVLPSGGQGWASMRLTLSCLPIVTGHGEPLRLLRSHPDDSKLNHLLCSRARGWWGHHCLTTGRAVKQRLVARSSPTSQEFEEIASL